MASEVKVDTISEKTSANGVAIDSVTLKDGVIEATGDTAAGDNAAMGYTSAEGLILTGQGSTNDITIKNDADADVITIATGTTVVGIPGSIDLAGAIDVDGTANLDVVDIDGAVDMASTLQVDGAITSSAGATITTADNTDTLSLISTDADANAGPNLRLYRNTGSPADDDLAGIIEWEGRNDNSQDVVYGQIKLETSDVSDGTEDGLMAFSVMSAGTLRNMFQLYPTEIVINQDSQDQDFRVESNGRTHALFVDAGNDKVGIGTSDPASYYYNQLTVTAGDEGGITIIDTSSGQSALAFADGTSGNARYRGRVLYDHATDTLSMGSGGDATFRIDTNKISTGTSAGSETSPDVSEGGITLNQNQNDDAIFTLKSTGDVTHGMTSLEQTDTWLSVHKDNATGGGIRARICSGQVKSLKFECFATGENTAEATSALSNFAVDARPKSGTSVASHAADDNIASFRTGDAAQFIVKGDGELWSNTTGTVSTFDEYDDAQLIRSFDLSRGEVVKGLIASKFDKFIDYNKEDLKDARLIGKDENNNPTNFMSINGFISLHNGAIWQQYEKHQKLANAMYELAKAAVGEEKANEILKENDIKLLN